MIGAFTGATVYAFFPPSYTEEREKKIRKMIGTDILEIETQHIVPISRDYSSYIKHPLTIIKLDKLFEDIREEKNEQPSFSKQYNLNTNKFHNSVDILLITGVSGSGKSELAEEYADKYVKKLANTIPDSLRTVKILRSEKIDDFLMQYREFAKELRVSVQNFTDEELIKEVNTQLAVRDNWLLVFDNIDNENKENYSKIKTYIPQTNGLKGRVIITARSPNIIPQDDHFKVKSIDVTQPVYRFTDSEILNLINFHLGNTHSEYNKSSTLKIELANKLGYLPQAVKNATLFIKYGAELKDIKSYLDFINRKLESNSSFKNIKSYTEENYLAINAIVNSKSIEEVCSNSAEVIDILSFSVFLNPDLIQKNLVKLKFKNLNYEKYLSAIDKLLNFGIFEDKGDGYFKLHRSNIDSIRKTIPMIQYQIEQKDRSPNKNVKINTSSTYEQVKEVKEKKFIRDKFEDIINFVHGEFKRDNTSVEDKDKNLLFSHHINTLLNIQQKQFKNEFTQEFLSFQIKLATYYMMSGNSIKAGDIFQNILKSDLNIKSNNHIDNLKQIDQLLNSLLDDEDEKNTCMKMYETNKKSLPNTQKNNKIIELNSKKNELEERININITYLKGVSTTFLSLFAEFFYHYGCVYYDIGNEDKKIDYKKNLEKAVLLRDIIDKKSTEDKKDKSEDAKYNEHMIDSRLVIRNGILKYNYRQTNDKNKLLEYIDSYNKEIKALPNDKKHIYSCKSEQFRIYQKLAVLHETSEVDRKKYCEQAAKLKFEKEIPGAFKDSGGVNYDILYNELMKKTSKDTREARYLTDFANLLFIIGDYKSIKKAGDCYKKAICLIEEKGNVNSDLPAAYLGLAEVSMQQDNYDLAQIAINRCLIIQKKLSMHEGHENAKKAEQLRYSIPLNEPKHRDTLEKVSLC